MIIQDCWEYQFPAQRNTWQKINLNEPVNISIEDFLRKECLPISASISPSSLYSFPTLVFSMMGSLESCFIHSFKKMISQNNYLQKAIVQHAHGLKLDPLFTNSVPSALIQTVTILIPPATCLQGTSIPRSSVEVQACPKCCCSETFNSISVTRRDSFASQLLVDIIVGS